MWVERAACAAVLLSAAVVLGCGGRSTVPDAEASSAPESGDRAGSLSVRAFRVSGWYDDGFHYLPALSVAAASGSRPVFVQRVDFTAEDAGARRLLTGIRYPASKRVAPGAAVDLVADQTSTDPPEIASPVALALISATVFFSDDNGQTGILTASAFTPSVPHGAAVASLAVRDFTVDRRRHTGQRFVYWPKLTLVETTGRGAASIKKVVFKLLDAVAAGPVFSVWQGPDVPAGGTVRLQTRNDSLRPWFEFDSATEASRVSVAVSFVDAQGRGGLVSALADVSR